MEYRITLKPRAGYYVPFLIMYDSSHFIIDSVRPYNPSANAGFKKKSYICLTILHSGHASGSRSYLRESAADTEKSE